MDIIKLMEEAIAEEEEAYQKYSEMAKNAPDQTTRILLEQLAKEEQNHREVLKKRLLALKIISQ